MGRTTPLFVRTCVMLQKFMMYGQPGKAFETSIVCSPRVQDSSITTWKHDSLFSHFMDRRFTMHGL